MQIKEPPKYNNVTSSFVLRVSPNIEKKVKHQIIESIKSVPSDSRTYVYHPKNLVVPKFASETVAFVAMNDFPAIDLNEAIRTAIYIMVQETKDYVKDLYVIMDSFDVKESYRLEKTLSIDIKEDYGINFFFCYLGKNEHLEDVCKTHPHCKVEFLEIEELNDFVKKEMGNSSKLKEDNGED